MNQGVAPILAKILEAPHPDTDNLEDVLCLIKNIASNCPDYREILLAHQVIDPLVAILKKSNNQRNHKIMKQSLSTFSILCKGKPAPDYETIKNAVPLLYSICF